MSQLNSLCKCTGSYTDIFIHTFIYGSYTDIFIHTYAYKHMLVYTQEQTHLKYSAVTLN
jgi:hypothetical protein